MTAPAPDRIEEIAKLTEMMSAEELAATWRALAEHVGERLSANEALDLAARAAAFHPGLRGRLRAIRALLSIVAGWHEIVDRVAGEPRQLFDPDQLADGSLKQARVAGEAVAAIWDEEVLPSSEAARRLGASPSNREKVNVYRRKSLLLGLPRDEGKRYLYPAFQIDEARHEIRPEVKEINVLLDAAGDPWGVASWWVSKSGRLDARPMDLVGTDRTPELVQAARAVVEPLG